MNKYHKAKIYKIVCNITGKIYIGSTCELLCQRIAKHRFQYKQWLNKTNNYTSSFEILKNGDYRIVLLEQYCCENKEELMKKEQEYIDKLECINQLNCFISKDKRKEQIKKWQENNKEQIKEKQKQWAENNKEQIKENQKQWREKNKQYINEKRKNQKITCDCGTIYRKWDTIRHEQSIKHQLYLLNETLSN